MMTVQSSFAAIPSIHLPQVSGFIDAFRPHWCYYVYNHGACELVASTLPPLPPLVCHFLQRYKSGMKPQLHGLSNENKERTGFVTGEIPDKNEKEHHGLR